MQEMRVNQRHRQATSAPSSCDGTRFSGWTLSNNSNFYGFLSPQRSIKKETKKDTKKKKHKCCCEVKFFCFSFLVEMLLVFGKKKKCFGLSVYFVDVNISCECALHSGCSQERQSVWALFWYTVFLSLFSYWCHIQNNQRQQPAVTHNTVHVVDTVNSHFGRITSDKREGGAGVFYRTVVFFSFTTFACFGVLISACSPGNFSSLCTNYKCKWSQETAVCGLLTKWLLTDALFSVYVVKLRLDLH